MTVAALAQELALALASKSAPELEVALELESEKGWAMASVVEWEG